MKKFFQSKTVWLGLATLAISLLTFFQGEEWVSPQAVAIIGTVIGVLTIVIRHFTNESMALTNNVKRKLRK